MTPKFKFLRRVRIHGGECGAVARALHHEVKSSSPYQADLEKSSGSTNERKQMSTKTTLKRIALVAVSALGFGLLSVMPAKAADESGNIDSISVSAAFNPRVGESATITAVLTDNAAGIAASDTVRIGARFLTDGGKPVGSSSTLAVGIFNHAATASTAAGSITTTQGADVRLSGSTNGTGYTTATIYNAVNFEPDVAGTYKLLVWVDSDANNSFTAGEKSASVTLTTTGSPTSVVLTKVSSGNPAISTGAWDTGALYSVEVKNASGRTRLTADEAISLTSSISTTTFKDEDNSTAATTVAYDDIYDNGLYYFYAVSTAAAKSTPTITVTANGGEIAAGVSASLATTFDLPVVAATLSTISDATATNTDGLASTLATDAFDVAPLSAVSLRAVGDTADEVVAAEITDTDGDLSGVFGAVYTQVAVVGASTTFYATFSFGGANLQAGHTWAADITDDSAAKTLTATAVTRAADATTVAPSSIRVVKGSAITFSGTTTDQYDAAIAGATVSWSVSGANTVASTAKISDADGVTSFTYTPAVSGTDTVATTYSGSATVTVVDTLEVGSVLLTTPHTTSTGVTEAAPTYSDIVAGAAGAIGTSQISVTATVKDAASVVLAGVPVTFTVSGTGAAVTSTTQTVYTGSTGTATAKVYGWIAGTYTVTATSGAKSDDAPVNFAQTTPEEARNITATVSGGIVTAKVTDRFGNGVYNAPVYATRTGEGNFAGASKANGNTGRDGTIEFIVSGGSADVTLSVGTEITYGQTDATAGLVASTTATDVFDDVVAGTALADEEGTGNTADYTKAGNNSVKVSVTVVDKTLGAAEAATDAAAEAIDAANAATDAANLAAEAADAATVAAEEARDAADAATAAVEELATQVATLMAALKAQITTLANTVAKIAKKVKA